ncbi:MAG: hypothetical protein WBP93_05255 [Pyrinomonadaceae bacterium]
MPKKIRCDRTPVKPEIRLEQQFSEHARHPGLIIVRAAGGREQGVFRQARALLVEINGNARLLALSHTHGTNVQPHARHYNSPVGRKAAA